MKLRTICKSKIHHATVTAADVDYIGSIGIDQTLMEMVDIIPGEQVSVWNVNNGMRIETYAIPLAAGAGEIVLNGAAARHFLPGDSHYRRRLRAHRRAGAAEDDCGGRGESVRAVARAVTSRKCTFPQRLREDMESVFNSIPNSSGR